MMPKNCHQGKGALKRQPESETGRRYSPKGHAVVGPISDHQTKDVERQFNAELEVVALADNPLRKAGIMV